MTKHAALLPKIHAGNAYFLFKKLANGFKKETPA